MFVTVEPSHTPPPRPNRSHLFNDAQSTNSDARRRLEQHDAAACVCCGFHRDSGRANASSSQTPRTYVPPRPGEHRRIDHARINEFRSTSVCALVR